MVRKKLITIVTMLIIILIFIGYKSFYLYNYEIDTSKISIGKELTVTSDKKITNQIQGNLKFTLSDDYKLDNTATTYSLNDNKYITFIEVPNVINNVCRYDKRLLAIDYIEIMTKNNMKDEVDILRYNNKHKTEKLSILSSIKRIKANYFSTVFVNTLNIEGEINILKGLDGFKYNKTLYLFNNGDMYKVVFTDNYEEKEILDILKTFKFN